MVRRAVISYDGSLAYVHVLADELWKRGVTFAWPPPETEGVVEVEVAGSRSDIEAAVAECGARLPGIPLRVQMKTAASGVDAESAAPTSRPAKPQAKSRDASSGDLPSRQRALSQAADVET